MERVEITPSYGPGSGVLVAHVDSGDTLLNECVNSSDDDSLSYHTGHDNELYKPSLVTKIRERGVSSFQKAHGA